MSQQPYKICPRCGGGADLHAPQCVSCGHLYRSQYPPPGHPPHAQYPSQHPPAQYPPAQYPPAQYPPTSYHVIRPGDIQGVAGGHSPWGSTLLTLVFVGLGQIINKQTAKGFVILLVAFFLCLMTLGVAALIIYPVVMIDAYCIASRLNRGEVVGPWQWF